MKDSIIIKIQTLSEELESQLMLRDNLLKNIKDTDRRIDNIKAIIQELHSLIHEAK